MKKLFRLTTSENRTVQFQISIFKMQKLQNMFEEINGKAANKLQAE